MSNRERVGRAFELLAEGLGPFVDQRLTAAAPAGADWAKLLEARDEAEHGAKRVHDKNDPAVQLRVLTEERRVFRNDLSRAEQSFASELRETRNRLAHFDAFSPDDAYRALDTIERLLAAVGAAPQADEVRRLRSEHQRVSYEAETKRLAKAQEAVVTVASAGLRPWREVLPPHEDVSSGNFTASEFAADLHLVVFAPGEETLGEEYRDPVEFFRRTFLTEGLKELLDRAIRRMTGDANASPIVNLQTNFGGGKTHSMLALWHLLSGTPAERWPQEVQELLTGRTLPAKVNRVALVGTHLSPAGGSPKPDGTRVGTLWGELAWQLGGPPAYAVVAEADTTRTNPGERLRDLVAAHAPCLILIDEWVAYARQLWGREDLPAGTFDTQFTFAQSLTEVVKTIPGAFLVISIPASHDPDRDGESAGAAIEVGGPNGQEALQRLQNVVRRVADQWRPASSRESFEIVRRRLFREPTAPALAEISAVARQFGQFYLKHTGEFPRDVTADPVRYEQRIKAAYPIHPELFDRLYEDWSTLERFQRTRGVLRLVSSVVHVLWMTQDASPLIMPGTLPLEVPRVTSEITQYLPDAWKPIVDTDVDGPGSTPVRIDAERSLLGQRAMTRRLARSIFVGSAPTLRSAHRGIDRQRAWLGAAVPGDVVGNFGPAAELLSQRSTYLYVEGSRYWYDTQASVTRTAADHAESLRERPEEVWKEIVDRLRGNQPRYRGGFAGVHAGLDSTADVPDTEDVRLAILHPSLSHSRGSQDSPAMAFAQEAFEHRGTSQRTNRNMVVFLAPDSKRLEELMEAVRDYLAWDWVHLRREELGLSLAQIRMVEDRRTQSGDAVTARTAQTYHWALIPDQPDPKAPAVIAVEKADGATDRLAERVTDKLARAGLLADGIASRSLRLELDAKLTAVWDRGHVSVGELWSYYCRYPYLTRLRDRSVLDDGVASALASITWALDGFALAQEYDEATGRYQGLVLPGATARFGPISDSTLLVAPDAATAQDEADRAATGPAGQPAGPTSGGPTSATGGPGTSEKGQGGGTAAPAAPPNTRFLGVYRIHPERYSRDFTRLSQEILQPLAAVEGATLSVTVEVHASRPAGFPDDKIRVVLENARTLRFEQAEFEDE